MSATIFIDWIRQFAGAPPEGLEWLEYVAAVLIFLMLFRSVFDIFRSAASFLNLRR